MRREGLFLVASVAGVAAACANAPIVAPSRDYPCGTAGVVCADASGRATGMCCIQGDECGPTLSCPAGACCYTADDQGELARRPSAQWRGR